MGEYLTAEMVEHHGSMIVINCEPMAECSGAKNTCVLNLDSDDQARVLFGSIVDYLEMTDVYLQPDAIKHMIETLLGPDYHKRSEGE